MTERKNRADMLQELDNIQHNNQETIEIPATQEPVASVVPSADNDAQWRNFKDYMVTYTGVKEQGSAVWLPSDVKKRLDKVRGSAKRNIPIRTMVSAIVMAFLDENESKLKEL